MKRNRLYSIILISVLLLCCSAVQGTTGNSLRIEGPDGWTKHLEVAQGSTAFLVVLAAKEGDGTLCDQYPDGSTLNYSNHFLGYDRLPFYANTPGRHVLSYAINGKESNPVVIDVKGTYAPNDFPSPSVAPKIYVMPQTNIHAPSTFARIIPRVAPISLSSGVSSETMMLQYYPVGAHIMNYQNGIVIPKYAAQHHFGKDFSLGTIDSNYPGTPFLTQFLADP
ncbi:MAG: hypothetical protein WCW68_02030 [Methanothrix sp.]